MTATRPDPERIPVVVASGQAIERLDLVNPVDLMARAGEEALADASGLRGAIDRLSVVNVMTRAGPAPASELARRLGVDARVAEVTTIGGNTPQWLVNRAASDIARGRLSVTLIAGAEAIRSSRARRTAGLPPDPGATDLPADPVVGDDGAGVGPAESAIGLLLPIHVYPMLESVLASRAGHDSPAHRQDLGRLLAPLTAVAAEHPFAWFPVRREAAEIA
ncbi:MAG TPA: hypothetical protein VII46_03980, partial [Acidimicrobiales bacterium]